MLRILYEYPLPNKRGRYSLSEKELRELLQKAYDNGFEHARNIYDSSRLGTITYASFEDRDDNTKWKEVWIK